MKNIVVPIDFSAASKNAAKYAASLAKSFDAEITLINVSPPAIIMDDPVFPFAISTESEMLQKNQELMKNEVKALTKEYEVKITGLAKQGYVPDMVEEMAKKKHADLIIMGRKGKGESNSFFGSTTTTIIRKLSFPVFVIPEKAYYKPIYNITFASDFDPKIEIANYKILMDFLEKFNSKIYILNVEKNDSSFNAEKAIGKMETNVAFAKRNYEFDTIKEKNVEEGISKFLKKNPSDILAMVAHKHTFLARILGKIHTTEMSYQTKIPLLVIPHK